MSAELKQELFNAVGLADTPLSQKLGAGWDDEIAELGIQAARAFLQGCGDRTIEVLSLIIGKGPEVSLRQLEKAAGVGESGLKGVWTGLTKRVRTITGDPEAALFDWSDETDDGDYMLRMSMITYQSFQRALSELED